MVVGIMKNQNLKKAFGSLVLLLKPYLQQKKFPNIFSAINENIARQQTGTLHLKLTTHRTPRGRRVGLLQFLDFGQGPLIAFLISIFTVSLTTYSTFWNMNWSRMYGTGLINSSCTVSWISGNIWRSMPPQCSTWVLFSKAPSASFLRSKNLNSLQTIEYSGWFHWEERTQVARYFIGVKYHFWDSS